MNRLCHQLNEKSLPREKQKKSTHECAIVWHMIKESFLSSDSNKTQKLSADICYEGGNATAVLTLNDGSNKKVDISLKTIREELIPKAQYEGLKTEVNSSNDEDNIIIFTFTFTPSNF